LSILSSKRKIKSKRDNNAAGKLMFSCGFNLGLYLP